MTYLTTTISREKLKLKDFDSDSMLVSESEPTKPISEKAFLAAAVELLALISLEAISSSNS